MKFVAVPSLEATVPLRELPRIAVDLGFSGHSKSSGLASTGYSTVVEPVNLSFAGCATAVAALVGQAAISVMILEAPLSAAFDAHGNPQARGDFESKPRPRWWSLGAGASMALAAQHFLSRLDALSPGSGTVHLVEGYVVGAESIDHKLVANGLLAAFNRDDPAQWHLPAGDERSSILQWLPDQPDRHIPIVLAPRLVQ